MSQLYQPLNPESYQIRLLSFSAGDGGVLTTYRLERYSLFSAPQYNALSYCWGNESDVTEIVVNGLRTSVTSNLAAALSRARELDPSQKLWADALCINQANDEEKSQQVKQMKHIYDRANVTYAWLGGSAIHQSSFLWQSRQPLPYQSKTNVYANVKSLLLKRLNGDQDDPSKPETWSLPTCQALLEVVGNEYWRRRWIIQELVTARQAKIVDQHAIIALEDLARALRRCSASPHWSTQHEMASKYLRQILELRQDYLEEKSLTLCHAIQRTKEYLSRDVRDRVYALTGICSDGQDLVPLPSYHQTREEVTRDLTRKFISRYARLDIVFAATAARSKPASLPSWTPDWLSSDLDSWTYAIANAITNAAQEYPRTLAKHALRAELNVLKVQGMTLGRIVRRTCPLGWNYARASNLPCECNDTTELISKSSYYRSTLVAADSLRRTLLPLETVLQPQFHPGQYRASYYLWRFHFLLKGLLRGGRRKFESHNEEWKAYSRWIRHHRDFMVLNETVGSMLRYRRMCHRAWLIPALWLLLALLDAFFITSLIQQAHARRESSPRTVIYYVISAVLSFLLPMYLLVEIRCAIYDACLFGPGSRSCMKHMLDFSASLVVLENGSIGMASGGAVVGDYVCFIAGCKSSAVLRPHSESQPTAKKFTAVGLCVMTLTQADYKKHEEIRKLLKSKQQDFGTVMDELEQKPGWREYDLI